LRQHWQSLFNAWLFLNLAGWMAWELRGKWVAGQLGYVDVAFVAQYAVFLGMILLRRPHRQVHGRVWHQLVALVAFFSGLCLVPLTSPAPALAVQGGIALTILAHGLGLGALFSLGRSFGILIALRAVKTGGLYGIVRHPMYLSDILLRVAYLVGHPGAYAATVVVASTICYGYRAVLEERFLQQQPEVGPGDWRGQLLPLRPGERPAHRRHPATLCC
jgi:protein-S-isoprenylcysteine O-methyltransferase Ste14